MNKRATMCSRQRSMGTKKGLVHEMLSKDAFLVRVSLRCCTHLLSSPGVEPHATSWRHPGPAVLVRALICQNGSYTSDLQLGRESPRKACLHVSMASLSCP